MSFIRWSCPRSIFKTDVFKTNTAYLSLSGTTNLHKTWHCRHHYLSFFHVLPFFCIIVNTAWRIILKPFSRFIKQFQCICKSIRRVASLAINYRLWPWMRKLYVTFGLMEPHFCCSISQIFHSLNPKYGYRPTLVNNHFQLSGTCQIIFRCWYSDAFIDSIKVFHASHYTLSVKRSPIGFHSIHP